MAALPILAKNQKLRACLKNKNLPANYMADFTVLGLVVDRLDAALRVLKDKKFEVHQNPDGFEININGTGRMTEVVELLDRKGIDYALTDIVDQVYQG
jgi:hypothetical protein